jgi:hypothetical protein
MGGKTAGRDRWLVGMRWRRLPFLRVTPETCPVVAVALANKTARIALAIVRSGRSTEKDH